MGYNVPPGRQYPLLKGTASPPTPARSWQTQWVSEKPVGFCSGLSDTKRETLGKLRLVVPQFVS